MSSFVLIALLTIYLIYKVLEETGLEESLEGIQWDGAYFKPANSWGEKKDVHKKFWYKILRLEVSRKVSSSVSVASEYNFEDEKKFQLQNFWGKILA